MGKTVDIKLRRLNFFVGPNGSGKSVLSDFLDLMGKNAIPVSWRNKQFPVISKFGVHEDWSNWATNGDLNQLTTLVKNDAFLGRRVIVKVQFKHSSSSCTDRDRQCKGAQVHSLVIQHGQTPLLVWNSEQRRVYTQNMASFIYKAIKAHGMPTEEVWQEELMVPTLARDLTLDIISEYMQEGPEFFEDTNGHQHFFYMDLGHLFFRKQLSIMSTPRFQSVQVLIEQILVHFQVGMIEFLTKTPVLTGKRKLVLDDLYGGFKDSYARSYFDFSLVNKQIKLEDGSHWGREIFLSQGGREAPLSHCSAGQRALCSWIEEWTEVVHKIGKMHQSKMLTTERLIFIQHPERDLSVEWQQRLMDMIILDYRHMINVDIVIETHSQSLLDYVNKLIEQNFISSTEVATFQFSLDKGGFTSVERLPHPKIIRSVNPKIASTIAFPPQQIAVRQLENWN